MTDKRDDAVRELIVQAHQSDPDNIKFDVAAGLAELVSRTSSSSHALDAETMGKTTSTDKSARGPATRAAHTTTLKLWVHDVDPPGNEAVLRAELAAINATLQPVGVTAGGGAAPGAPSDPDDDALVLFMPDTAAAMIDVIRLLQRWLDRHPTRRIDLTIGQRAASSPSLVLHATDVAPASPRRPVNTATSKPPATHNRLASALPGHSADPGSTQTRQAPDPMRTPACSDAAATLAAIRRLVFVDRLDEAMSVIEGMLAGELARHDRVAALILRLIALLNMGRSGEYAAAVDAAMEATRQTPDPAQYAEIQALAAIVAVRGGSIDRAVRHLVWAARALNAVELADATTSWAWHNLAMAYSYSGFHGHATAAIERAREVATDVGLTTASTDLAVPALRVRLAVDLDQRGDTEGCKQVLRDIIKDLEQKNSNGLMSMLRPVSHGAYGYAILRLHTLDAREHLTEISPTVLLNNAGDSARARDFRTLGAVCQAIAERRPHEALARLETANVGDHSLGAAEIHRLRALAHQIAGDNHLAHLADRHAFRIASVQIDSFRELFIDGVAARLDREELLHSVDQLRGEANTDPLTGLPNRRYLEQYLTELAATGRPAVLGLCDVDGFRSVNAAHGHLTGDLVLQRVAEILHRVVRDGQLIARYGGDEFVIVLPATSTAETELIGRRIKAAVADEDWHRFVRGTPINITIGWADLADTTPAEAFDAANHAMRHAKARRRAS